MAESFDELTPQQVASACEGGKRVREDHYKALCPVHADKEPSLDIKRKDGKLLVICRAGCSQQVVFEGVRDRCNSAGLLRRLAPTARRRQSLDDRVLEFNRRYGVVDYAGRILVGCLRCDTDNFRVSPVFYEPAQLARKYANDIVTVGKKKMSFAEYWFTHPNRRTYESVTFAPTSERIVTPQVRMELPPGPQFNLWQGYLVRPQYAYLTEPRSIASGESSDACSRIIEHVRDVLCGGVDELFEYWMAWYARLVQIPGECGRTALVMQSPEGAGKDTVTARAIAPLFGSHSFAASRPLDILGRFNEHLGMAVHVVFNEAAAATDKAMVGAMKQLITDPQLPVEQKYHPRIMIRNCVHLIIHSNEAQAVVVSNSDRRFVFFPVSAARIGDGDYFRGIHQEIDLGGREALLGVLLGHDIGGKDIANLPAGQSAARYEHQLYSADSVERFVLEMLGMGEPVLPTYGVSGAAPVSPVSAPEGGGLPDWDREPVTYVKEDFHRAYLTFCAAHQIPRRLGNDLFFRQIESKFKGLANGRSRPTVEGKRRYVITFPALGDARRIVQATVRGTIPWSDGGSE